MQPSRTLDCYSAVKRKEVGTHATAWTNLENMLSEGSQTQKLTNGMIPFLGNVQNNKAIRAESRGVFARGWKEGRMQNACLVGMRFPFGVPKISRNLREVVVAQLNCRLFKTVNFMVREPHLNLKKSSLGKLTSLRGRTKRYQHPGFPSRWRASGSQSFQSALQCSTLEGEKQLGENGYQVGRGKTHTGS